MSIKEFYSLIGGSYDDIHQRIFSDELIKKYVLLFKNDESFVRLSSAIESNDFSSAFLAAHTLKGLSLNLGFVQLSMVASTLTEVLRHFDGESCDAEFAEVKKEYELIISAINNLN